MAAWDRESRYGDLDREEAQLRKGRVTPGKRSLTHSAGSSFADVPAPGKVPATLGVTDETGGVGAHGVIPRDLVARSGGDGSGGAPDAGVRARVEATTGADLSDARVHTGPDSQANAAALRAKAFTVGSDIHFAAGQYQPGTAAGGHLLAHELVHTVQQGGAAAGPQLKATDVSQEGDAAEVEADHIAGIAMSGASSRVAPVARAAGISRAPEQLSGNPAEATNAAGAATTSHRSVNMGDVVNAPKAGTKTTQIGEKNVKVVRGEASPLHVEPLACPLPDLILQEDNADSPPPGFSHVTEVDGTVAAPQVQQEAAKGLYIGGAPRVDDVQQGGLGDCYMQADLQSIVARDPGKIPSMMTPDGNGGATVMFWRCQDHKPSLWERIVGGPKRDWIQVAVTVTDQLQVHISNNRVRGAQLRGAPDPKSYDYWAKINGTKAEVHRKDTFEVARWAPLMEKAYARFAQAHGQYGGAHASNTFGGTTSGYKTIEGGYALEALYPFYGAAMDDPTAGASWHNTSYPTTGSLVAANANVMDKLILLQGRGSETRAGDTDAPILTVGTSEDGYITRLQQLIPVAQADPDWAKVEAPRQVLVATVLANINTWTALPADPPLPAAQPKATARTAIGTSCGVAVRPGLDESQGEKDRLAGMRSWAAPIQFAQGEVAVPAPSATGMKNMHSWLKAYQSPPVAIQLDGHSSSEGSDEVNMRVSQQRVDNVETEITKHGPTPPHTISKTAHGEEGATRDASWRKVVLTLTPTGHATNGLLDPARSRPIQDAVQLMVNLRNMGTDNSPGQRNIYGGHAYSVVAVNIVTTEGKQVPLASVPAANRAALYPLVNPDTSTVTLRNPHHGNEPDRRDNNTPERAGDGKPSGPTADGLFTVTLREFFLNFQTLRAAVMPKT